METISQKKKKKVQILAYAHAPKYIFVQFLMESSSKSCCIVEKWFSSKVKGNSGSYHQKFSLTVEKNPVFGEIQH